MNATSANEQLNRLLILHHRSLPMYLSDARPWSHYQCAAEAETLLNAIVADQRRSVDEIVALLTERNHLINYGEFPLSYTGLHDLSFRYLLRKMTEQQKRQNEQIEAMLPKLSGDALALALAERCLGAGKAHLEMLQQAAKADCASAA